MSTVDSRTRSQSLVPSPVEVNFNRRQDVGALRKIALLGTFPPRQCGIATYTADVLKCIQGACPQADVFALAVSKGGVTYDYPAEVAMEVRDNDPGSYRGAADYLNGLKPDVLCVQHEYGIFGGEAGSHLFELLENCEVPVVTIMHTVLADPSPEIRRVTLRLLQATDRVIVMTRMAADLLRQVYGSAGTPMIDIIPHGIPDIPFLPTTSFKAELDLQDRFVMLTFGLLSPGKGIEHAIEAMPEIVAADPSATYVILGATHPCLVESEGETYRESLMNLAQTLGVGDNVRFVNEYVDIDRLTQFLGAADVYVTPYLNEAQITSGTLAYASGSGRPVVSTPYWHAKELITAERGFIVPFRDSGAIACAVCRLIADRGMRDSMRRESWQAGRVSTWAAVGQRFALSCAAASAAVRARRDTTLQTPTEPDTAMLLFPFMPSRDHLRAMLTPLGIWQHAAYQTPDRRHGFCTDDNARALILAGGLMEGGDDSQEWATVVRNCFQSLEEAYNQREDRFRNFRDAQGHWLEEMGSPDSHGRALWACGVMAGMKDFPDLRGRAKVLLIEGLGSILELPDLRPGAFAALGIAAVLTTNGEGQSALRIILRSIANRLKNAYRQNARDGWNWFEDHLTYDNAKLPQALITAGVLLQDHEALGSGLEALNWLMEVQSTRRGYFRPVGCHGWMKRGDKEAAQFDQQPLEAWASTAACLAAMEATGDPHWAEQAKKAYHWFLGENDLGLSLYEPANGGVYDGLHPEGLNRNQGAESLLSFHLAHLEMAGKHPDWKIQEPPAEKSTLLRDCAAAAAIVI